MRFKKLWSDEQKRSSCGDVCIVGERHFDAIFGDEDSPSRVWERRKAYCASCRRGGHDDHHQSNGRSLAFLHYRGHYLSARGPPRLSALDLVPLSRFLAVFGKAISSCPRPLLRLARRLVRAPATSPGPEHQTAITYTRRRSWRSSARPQHRAHDI